MSDRIPPFDELPELTLSLRSFGSRRHASPNESLASDDEQERFFAPLLAGRRSAAHGMSRPQVVAAFDARRMTATIDATVRSFAAERFAKRTPGLRAFEAELFEMLEPLHDSLQRLRDLADSVPTGPESPDQYQRWTVWLAQLRAVFRIADASWPQLRRALDAWPRLAVAKSRWRRNQAGDDNR